MILYLIKFSICSALLFLGYLLIAREKRFQVARFYLLFSLLFSMIAPLVPVSFNFTNVTISKTEYMLQSVVSEISNSNSSSHHVEGQVGVRNESMIDIVLVGLYIIGSLFMAYRFIRNFSSIFKLLRRSEKRNDKGLNLALVDHKIGPFSFGKYIFLSKSDYHEQGPDQYLFTHERSHVQHLHTLDVLFIETILIFFWYNPIIWVYRRAIKETHEYFADQVVLKTADLIPYADLLLAATQKNTISLFGSHFNYSLTKKRLLMMNRTKTSRLNFGYKLTGTFLIFLASFLIFAFQPITPKGVGKEGNFIVVIDASHGGTDSGAVNDNLNIKEKDITLAISNQLVEKTDSKKITYVLLRSKDEFLGLKDRVSLVNQANADLLISLHLNENPDPKLGGLEVYYSENNGSPEKSVLYAKMFHDGLRIGTSDSRLRTAPFKMLKDVNCPAVLLELGFVSNEEDARFMSSAKNQQQVAKKISEIVQAISKK